MERDLRADLSAGQGSGLSPTAAGRRRFPAGPPPLALYVHLPWCVRKCPYCDFNSHALSGALPEGRYLDALMADLDAQWTLLEAPRPLQSVFIGGGTPSLFSGTAIGQILDRVRGRFALVADVEITLEANPGTVDAGHFQDYLRSGVSRLSIGVQSLSADHLGRLGRIHDPRQAREAVQVARAAGFENINLDMMFALPRQSLTEAGDDLKGLIDLQPEHVSYYQLTLEPNTAFAHAPPPLPDDELASDMQDQGIELLAAAGYQRYEVSAFAKSGGRCRHNLNYWSFGDYIGIGAGAHGKLTDSGHGRVVRRACQRHPDAYSVNPARPSSRRQLSDADLVLEFALNALRLVDGVQSEIFERHTGLPLQHIESVLGPLRDDGLLAPETDRIKPTALGLRFLNDVLARFAMDCPARPGLAALPSKD